VGRVKQAADRGLLDELLKDIVDNVFKISEKPINCISGQRSIESATVPDKAVLEFSCDWTRAVDIFVIAVEELTE
jgi:hypothetical protein